ncbi:GNAT family N-acetyltransferase [Streptomyces sp. NPDC047002]|uniref:GNAT family N-acetyltransferase n=1 Tax=Streptomyces sp. NPDC047002 TaxID=3155475 RepID=UPI003454811C
MARPGEDGARVTIRRAVARDAKRLTALVGSSRAYEGRYASAVEGYRVGPDYIEAHQVHVATEPAQLPGGGRILGFYALLLTPPEPELDLMFVADCAQGRGIGRLLARHMQRTARAAGAERVRVVSHPPAEGFYTAMGATRTGTDLAHPPAVPWDRPELTLPTTP